MNLICKILLFFLLIHPTRLFCQSFISPGIKASNDGLTPFIEYNKVFIETSKKGVDFKFGPRLGYAWDVFGNRDHFYFQQVLSIGSFSISPFWLRGYNKTIGYQVPVSVAYNYKYLEFWGNYIPHHKLFDFHAILYIEKYKLSISKQ